MTYLKRLRHRSITTTTETTFGSSVEATTIAIIAPKNNTDTSILLAVSYLYGLVGYGFITLTVAYLQPSSDLLYWKVPSGWICECSEQGPTNLWALVLKSNFLVLPGTFSCINVPRYTLRRDTL